MQDHIHKKLFLTAESFFKVRPWDLLDNEDIFGLFLKDTNQLWFGAIMGSGGMEYGVLFMKGWEGYRVLSDLSDDNVDHDTAMNASAVYSLSLAKKEELPPGFIKYHRKYLSESRLLKPFPCFMVKESLKVFKTPSDSDAERLYLLLRAIIKLIDKNLLKPDSFLRAHQIIIFEVSKKDDDIRITSRYEDIADTSTAVQIFEVDMETLTELKSLPQLPTIYNIAAPTGIVAVRDKTPRIFLVHEEKTDCILSAQVFYGKGFETGAFDVLKDVFLGKADLAFGFRQAG